MGFDSQHKDNLNPPAPVAKPDSLVAAPLVEIFSSHMKRGPLTLKRFLLQVHLP